MMSAIESTSSFIARPTPVALKLSGYTAAVVAKIRAVAPYALIELILPGGSVMALLLWLYRRQRKVPVFATDEILALL
jgi:chromate transport protein ChrA